MATTSERVAADDMKNIWWARQDLNLGPTDYESAALTTELQARRVANILH